ncbi:hypothetical protein L1281_000582 [Neisseria sp. HSC-16F19]|nr:hypothetical protein [Neisseria sp. HSC-16F19]MCP2040003.1 hypothetical protein [Neisseria sp. HSC-16F19]
MFHDAPLWLYLLCAASEVLALWLIWRLWRSNEALFFKIAFSLLCLIPLLGPLFTLTFFNMPPPHHPAFKDNIRLHADVFDRWRHILSEKSPQARLQLWWQLMNKYDEPPHKKRGKKRPPS